MIADRVTEVEAVMKIIERGDIEVTRFNILKRNRGRRG
jgi:hypothetical protein